MKHLFLFLIALSFCIYNIGAKTLDSFTGQWICYKFEKSNYPLNEKFSTSTSGFFNENFAKEFAKYSYFNIVKQNNATHSIVVVDRFKIPNLTIFRIDSVNNQVYEHKVAKFLLDNYTSTNSFFLKTMCNYTDYVDNSRKTETILPYYGWIPFSELMYVYLNTEIIVPYRGFLFFYKRGEYLKSEYNIEGIPGDVYNYFTVTTVFNNINIEDAYKKFLIDFPFVADGFPKKMPQTRYTNYEGFHDITMELINESQLNIRVNNSMGVFKVEFKQIGTEVHLLYKSSDYDEDFGPDYQG